MQPKGQSEDYASQQEFYREKAEHSKLLDDMITGEDTFKKRLDWLIEMVEPYNPHKQFGEYLDFITELGATGLDREELEKRYNALFMAIFKDAGQFLSVCAIGIGAILCIVGPLIVMEPLVVAAGGASIAALRKSRKYCKDTQKRKDEIFKPLYDVAESLDHQIGTYFLLNHFSDNRKRFEETYVGMSEKEREAADELLYEFLSAGGMRGMGELELKDYLEGLPEPEVEFFAEPEGDE